MHVASLPCRPAPCQSRAPAVNGVHYTTRGDYIHVIRNDEIRTPPRRRHGTSGSGPAKFLLRAGNLVILDEALVLVRDGWTDGQGLEGMLCLKANLILS